MKKRLLAGFLAVYMVVTMLPIMSFADEVLVTQGACGENATWSFDSTTGILTISGTGAMRDYGYISGVGTEYAPWNHIRESIRSVVVSEGIMHIGNNAFGGNTNISILPNLSSVRLPNTLKSIGEGAFESAGQLTEIILPDSLISIGNFAFSGTDLHSLHIPPAVKTIGIISDSYEWTVLKHLDSITVADGNENFIVVDDVLYQKNSASDWRLLFYPIGKTSVKYVMPDQVSHIDVGFAQNQYLESVDVSPRLEEIPNFTFFNCQNLLTVTLPEGITSIDPNAFADCPKLSRLDIPSTVRSFVSTANVGPAVSQQDSGQLSVYFRSATAPAFDGSIAQSKAYTSEKSGKVIIYYPENAIGWDEVQRQEDVMFYVDQGVLEFQTWDEEISATANIVGKSPINGATGVTYDTAHPLELRVTFDRGIDHPDADYKPSVDLTVEDRFSIYRASDDALIYQTSDAFSSSFSADFTMSLDEKTFIIKPNNAHTLLLPSTEYYVVMGEGLVKFKDGTVSPAIVKGQWSFTTATPTYSDQTAEITFRTGGFEWETATKSILWNDGWFDESATTYNHDLAIASLALSGAAYVDASDETVIAGLKALGFSGEDPHYIKPTQDNRDTVSYTFAKKELYADGKKHTLVAVVVKGTSADDEWYSNFDVGTGKIHKGFGIAAAGLMEEFNKYVGEINGPVKFLVTGHSRGAAVANLVAAELTKRNALPNAHSPIAYGQKNVYGYTFATPKASMDGTEAGYENIYNILNPEDLVTRVALSDWGFNHYGVDLILPSKSFNDWDYVKNGDTYVVYPFYVLREKMERDFINLTGEEFESYGGTKAIDCVVSNIHSLAQTAEDFSSPDVKYSLYLGTVDMATTQEYFHILAGKLSGRDDDAISKILASMLGTFKKISGFFINNENNIWANHFSHAHSVAAYYSWMTVDVPPEILYNAPAGSSTEVTFKRVVIACPVDVYIRDQNGTVVASVVDEEIAKNTLAVYVEDGEKTFDLPSNHEYSIEIVARDEGTVSYKVEELGFANVDSSVLRTVTFDNIDIVADDVLTGKVDDPFSIPANDYALTKNGNEIIYATSDSAGPIAPTDLTWGKFFYQGAQINLPGAISCKVNSKEDRTFIQVYRKNENGPDECVYALSMPPAKVGNEYMIISDGLAHIDPYLFQKDSKELETGSYYFTAYMEGNGASSPNVVKSGEWSYTKPNDRLIIPETVQSSLALNGRTVTWNAFPKTDQALAYSVALLYSEQPISDPALTDLQPITSYVIYDLASAECVFPERVFNKSGYYYASIRVISKDIIQNLSSHWSTPSPAHYYNASVSPGTPSTPSDPSYDYIPSGGSPAVSQSYTITVQSPIRNGKAEPSRTSAAKGNKVMITVTPDGDYELETLVVKDANGNTVNINAVDNNHYEFIMPGSNVTVNATFIYSVQFTDVTKDAFYYDAVLWATENSITNGTGTYTFSPTNPCTRGEIVTFLWRVNGSPKVSGSNIFVDVDPNAFFYDAILWAVSNGITNGTGANTFSPYATCTRGEAVTFLHRSKGAPTVSGNTFTDVSSTAFYADAVSWAVSSGVTNGTGTNTFGPNNICTRGEIVTFLYRAN